MPLQPRNLQIALELFSKALRNDTNSQIRAIAAQALGKLGDDAAFEQLIEAWRNDRDIEVRRQAAKAIVAIHNRTMSETPKVQMNFNAPVSGVAGNVEGDMIVNPIPKTPAESAAEIQALLAQLAATNPTVNAAVIHREIQQNPTFKAKLQKTLQAGGIETLKVIFAPLGIPIEMIRAWLT